VSATIAVPTRTSSAKRSEPRQAMTGRGLREADALAGAPHMRLVQQGFQQHQQVHIHGR